MSFQVRKFFHFHIAFAYQTLLSFEPKRCQMADLWLFLDPCSPKSRSFYSFHEYCIHRNCSIFFFFCKFWSVQLSQFIFAKSKVQSSFLIWVETTTIKITVLSRIIYLQTKFILMLDKLIALSILTNLEILFLKKSIVRNGHYITVQGWQYLLARLRIKFLTLCASLEKKIWGDIFIW